ncbi:MAG TPA: YCF48-related protein [Thermoanaerobaculia bacterium]|nr:YCF48-related protein [Thermoanaerobaculia bacterium]
MRPIVTRRSNLGFRGTASPMLFGAALITFASVAHAGAPPSWVPIGPQGGEIDVLAAAPRGRLYAGALFGAGVSRSSDGGRHWSVANHGLPQGPISALAVVAGHPEIVYAGGIQFGPYVSSDGGDSWAPALAGFEIGGAEPIVAALAVTTGGSVYALSATGALYKTRPPRRSWTRVDLPALAASLTADPRQPETLYAGVAGGLVRTRDGGASWDLLGGGVFPAGFSLVAVIDPSAPSGLYALWLPGSTLFHSVDDGLSWVSHPVPLASGSYGPPPAVAADGKILIASTNDFPIPASALIESADGGATWTTTAGAPPDFLQTLLAVPGEAAVYAGGERGFWLSTDSGDHWRASSHGLYAQAVVSIRIGASGATTFLYASAATLSPGSVQDYLFRRETGGAFMEVDGPTYAVIGVDPVRPEVVYGSHDSGQGFYGIWKSADGGLTWSATGFPSNEVADVFKIDPSSTRILYAGGTFLVGTSCPLRKSTDGGKTWTCLLTSPDLDAYLLLIDPMHTTRLYLVASSGWLFISRDGGASWRRAARGLPPGQPLSILAIDPSDSRRLYAAVQVSDQTAAVYVSRDGALSWTLLAGGLPGPITSLKVDPRQPETLLAGIILTGILRSTDGGRHWSPFDQGLQPGSFWGGFLFDPVHPSIIYTVTNGAGVYMLDTGQ